MEKEMVTYSSTVAWIIPWIEEAGRLQSMRWQQLNMTEWLSKQQNRKSLYLKEDHVGKALLLGEQPCILLLALLFSHSVVSNSFVTPRIGIIQARILEWVAVSFFPTQASNLSLFHCREILYRLSHQGSPLRTLETYFSSNFSTPGTEFGTGSIKGNMQISKPQGDHYLVRKAAELIIITPSAVFSRMQKVDI